MNPRVIAIVQARMSSSRLPGKVLKNIAGEPMLVHVVERARQARRVNEVVVATTTQPEDDAIEALCHERGYSIYRGSLHDVLDRFYQAALTYSADVVVRLTADCPLLDPGVVDHTVEEFFKARVDFAANRLPPPFKRTYPIGLDTEVCSFAALQKAWQEATEAHDREHVMPYLYEEPGRFKVLVVNYERDFGKLRWTVDTPEDLDLVRAVFDRLKDTPDFTWLDVLALFEREPQLATLNAGVKHKSFMDVDSRSGKA